MAQATGTPISQSTVVKLRELGYHNLADAVHEMNKSQKLAELEGFHSPLDMCEKLIGESVIPGICSNENCDYTTDVEPDQGGGFCEDCGTQTVVSIFVMEGII